MVGAVSGHGAVSPFLEGRTGPEEAFPGEATAPPAQSDGFPRLLAARAALLPSPQLLTGRLRKLEKALTGLAAGSGLQSVRAAGPVPRRPRGPPLLSPVAFLPWRDLSTSHMWFCFSFWLNNHFADFPPASAAGPRRGFF